MRVTRVEHRFVDQVPDELVPGILYVSLPFRTTVHLCACGCDNQTWVRLRPQRHHLIYDGETVTLRGSIGNWRFPCRSHYWILNSRIVWADGEVMPSCWQRTVSWLRRLVKH
ncbi:MAG: DUF6527 family protein [Actinomycetota bacterium]